MQHHKFKLLIFILWMILLFWGIISLLFSCKTTQVYNITYVKDTVYVEKPVKMGWGYEPNFPIYTPPIHYEPWLDSILKIQHEGKLIIDSGKTYCDSIILLKPYIKSNFFISNPNYIPATEWHDAIINYGNDTGSHFIIISGDSLSVKTIEGSIIIGGTDCDTGKAFINIGPSQLPVMIGNYEHAFGYKAGRVIDTVPNCTNCTYIGTDLDYVRRNTAIGR